ncbi:alpha-(1,3)-fucosyltransferase fut-5-like [Ruditapes philippinarum]|uniref:alpha-(1,3)-fucosyltransferase fut-5-like n=1 Tax=Ruditapes philippinarum TaxID=129788 RepID=UPI00295B4C70|nr:alpha-(1,3)-fucosyltransferase fut-5-like [Ruditapes philippinarum]
MMKSRLIMKRNNFVLIGIVLVVFLLTTILFVPEFLTHYSYSNAYAGKHAYFGPVSSDQDQEDVKSMLQHLLSVSTVIRDNRFVDSSIFWIQEKIQSEKAFTISWMNKPNWLSLESLTHFLGRRCTYKNCKMTEYKQDTSYPDALVFNTKNQLPSSSLSVFKLRPGTQVWIFFQMEPPSRITTNWFRQESFRYAFNWSWSYRLDSDILRPIGTLIMNTGFSNISYSAILQKKTKIAPWIVSHFGTQTFVKSSSLVLYGKV